MQSTDNIYRDTSRPSEKFTFDAKVAHVFTDMIRRSVPGYSQIITLLPSLARQNRHKNANYYDLGCSLGAGMLAIAQGLQDLNATIIGIDNSQDMLDKASELIKPYFTACNSKHQLICEDITQSQLNNAALVLMNFTLQFIPISQRKHLLKNIHQQLLLNGVLVLSEKISIAEEEESTLFLNLHHQFKADQGYSDIEISKKRDAIENVLIPETLTMHTQRLKEVGFRIVIPWIQNLQFISLLAIK